MTVVRFIAVPLAALALFTVAAPGCSSGSTGEINGGDGPGTGDGGTGSTGSNDTICLLNNCDYDRDCADCADGATVCDQSEHRCVACGASANGKTCGSGQTCTKYGACVGNGVSCSEDANGVPTITCKNTADCGACGPSYRVCDTSKGKCVGCTSSNTTNCQSTDTCNTSTGACAPKCPSSCEQDSDCGQCGTAAKPAQACNEHVCAQCSPTKPCTSGKCDLTHGVCVPECGLGDRAGTSDCTADGNCAGCTATTKCNVPVNGGEGTCAVPATGCSDIGKGIIVLPAPFDQYTQACSNDTDCANQSINLNVGKLLRDATGLSAIKDGNLSYSEHSCADVTVLDKSCGVCVPCKADTDCADIDVSQVTGDIFGPLGSVAADLLLDKAFGPNDHKIHMFCQNVAGDYGVCVPCPDLLNRCGQSAGNIPTTGTCNHDLCTKGDALNPAGEGCTATDTSSCVTNVCEKDPYCCVKEWDAQCIIDVDQYCQDQTCTPGECAYRQNGWYCNPDPTKGGYYCSNNGSGEPTTAGGYQCATGTECTTANPGPKEPAVLCTEEGDDVPGCPVGSTGKPKCVATQ